MLLYLVKHLRPDIMNTVQQLSKALNKPNKAVFKEMLHVVKFVIDMKEIVLIMRPKLQW